MTSEERIQKQKELVESLGRFYDKQGFQPIAGRILGLLIVMDKELYTFDEIVEELNISKSSASNALKILELMHAVEYKTITGDRKRYFKLKTQDKFALINEHKLKLQSTVDFLKQVIELKANKNTENSIFIDNMINMIDFFIDKFEDLKKEYSQQNKSDIS